jgi:hypothetical protein
MSPQSAFRSWCNAPSSLAYWASARRTSRNSADDSAHDRANRAGHAADRRTCYRASCLLRDWRNLDFFRRLRTFFLFWFWMIRHKLRLLHSGSALYISQTRVDIAVTKLKISWTVKARAALNPTIETSEGAFASVFASDFRANKLARVLTDTPIRRSPDCAGIGTEGGLAMALASSIELCDAEKLNVLRRLDQFRQWHSLDEKRYCLVCGEIITGREIRVIESTRGDAKLRVICPTEHCDAMPMEWAPPTEEVLIKIAMVEAECRWLRLVMRAGRAMQCCQSGRTSNTTSRTGCKPRLR